MDVGILAPVVGVVLAVVIVFILRRVMRVRAATKTQARTAESALTESEQEFLDSSHIGGPMIGSAADPGWKASGRPKPPPDRVP